MATATFATTAPTGLRTLASGDIPRVRDLLARFGERNGPEERLAWLLGLPAQDREFLLAYALAALDTAVNVVWARQCLPRVRYSAEEINLDGGV
jgi:hypothetical protein